MLSTERDGILSPSFLGEPKVELNTNAIACDLRVSRHCHPASFVCLCAYYSSSSSQLAWVVYSCQKYMILLELRRLAAWQFEVALNCCYENFAVCDWLFTLTKNAKMSHKNDQLYGICCSMCLFRLCRVCYVSVSSRGSYVASLSQQARTCTRRWWRRRCRYESMHAISDPWLQNDMMVPFFPFTGHITVQYIPRATVRCTRHNDPAVTDTCKLAHNVYVSQLQ